MIISTNRMSTMNGNFVVAANESYGIGDIGAILIEAEHNDMAIFNAILKSDFTEIRARQEGTMLESELTAMTEASAKGLFDSLAGALQKFWAKIKGVFKDAYAMIASYCVRHGKTFVKMNKKAIDALADNAEVKGAVWAPKGGAVVKFTAVSGLTVDHLMKKEGSASQIAKGFFDEAYGKSEKGLYDGLKNKYFEKKEGATLASFGGKAAMVELLQSGKKAIADLKKAEDEVEKNLKESIKQLKEAAKNDKVEDAPNYRKASSALTHIISGDTRAKIRLIKFQLLQNRIALARAINPAAKEEGETKALEESVIDMVAISEMEDMEATSEMAPELAEEVLEIVADAIEKAADEVGGEEETPAEETKEEPVAED